MKDNEIISYGIRANTTAYDLEKGLNALKLASTYMTVIVQDAEDKEKYFEIKPDTKLIFWEVHNNKNI